MVKHTQTICRQKPRNCLSVFDHFVGLVLKGFRESVASFKSLTHFLTEVFPKNWLSLGISQLYNYMRKNLVSEIMPGTILERFGHYLINFGCL